MKKFYILAMMLCLLILPATVMAAPSENAQAFASEEAVSTQWINTMLTNKDANGAYNMMSAEAKKSVKAADLQKAEQRMAQELGNLKETRFVAWTRFDNVDQMTYLMSFDKTKAARCELIFNKKGELDSFVLTPLNTDNAKNAKADTKKK